MPIYKASTDDGENLQGVAPAELQPAMEALHRIVKKGFDRDPIWKRVGPFCQMEWLLKATRRTLTQCERNYVHNQLWQLAVEFVRNQHLFSRMCDAKMILKKHREKASHVYWRNNADFKIIASALEAYADKTDLEGCEIVEKMVIFSPPDNIGALHDAEVLIHKTSAGEVDYTPTGSLRQDKTNLMRDIELTATDVSPNKMTAIYNRLWTFLANLSKPYQLHAFVPYGHLLTFAVEYTFFIGKGEHEIAKRFEKPTVRKLVKRCENWQSGLPERKRTW